MNKEILENFSDDILDSADYERLEVFKEWKDGILAIAKHYRIDVSAQNIYNTSLWNQNLSDFDVIRTMSKKANLGVRVQPIKAVKFSPWLCPVLAKFKDGHVAIIKSFNKEKNEVLLSFIHDQGLDCVFSYEALLEQGDDIYILRPLTNIPDSRIDSYIKPVEKFWIWRIIFSDIKPYTYVIVAALMVNLLGLSGILYSMQTYDRIIPAQSYPTMWVLFVGVLLAYILEYCLRLMRYSVIDVLGKKADIKISDRVFGHSLRIQNTARPKSTGTFIAQIRELEGIRELLTSSTIVSFIDLPFFFIFVVIIYFIGGIVFVVPLVGMLLMIIPGLLCQKKLAEYATASAREASLRNAMLVETVQGLDDIKVLQAEQRFQQQWFHYTCTTSDKSLELKHLTHKLSTWTATVQNLVFATVVLVATPLAMDGDLTVGAMVASAILSSRMMAPITQISNLITRWQQVKVSIESLDAIMQLPTDSPEFAKQVHSVNIKGNYKFEGALFTYGGENSKPILYISELEIKEGEKIAILGRNGSGKSSLLKALVGLLQTTKGVVKIDNININQLDPSDLRRDVTYLSQESRLFHGSIRDNLTLGSPLVSDQEIMSVVSITGIKKFIDQLPNGLDYMIQEGGYGLSGGQLQSLLLARTMLRSPNVILLDEPTASLDDIAEKEFVENLGSWSQGKTLIVATHRKRVLEIVDRIIIISDGQIYKDQLKSEMTN